MEIERQLMKIFERFNIDFKRSENLKDKNLLGKEFKLKSRDLLIIFFMVESEFSITIPKKEIIDGRFDTYWHILEIVKNAVV